MHNVNGDPGSGLMGSVMNKPGLKNEGETVTVRKVTILGSIITCTSISYTLYQYVGLLWDKWR